MFGSDRISLRFGGERVNRYAYVVISVIAKLIVDVVNGSLNGTPGAAPLQAIERVS